MILRFQHHLSNIKQGGLKARRVPSCALAANSGSGNVGIVRWSVLDVWNRLAWDASPLRSSCVTRASVWASIPSRARGMHPSDSSLTSLCTPAPSPVGHFTPQRSGFLSLALSLSLCGEEKWGEAVFLLSSWCSQLWGAKELWRYVPCLTLLQTGPDISFHHRCKHWTGRASTLKCYKFVLRPVYSYVRVRPPSPRVAQLFNIYLVHVEETNLRVTGGLMQSSNRIRHVSFSHHLFPTVAGWVGFHDGQWIYRPGPPEQGGKKTTLLETRRASPAPFSTYSFW